MHIFTPYEAMKAEEVLGVTNHVGEDEKGPAECRSSERAIAVSPSGSGIGINSPRPNSSQKEERKLERQSYSHPEGQQLKPSKEERESANGSRRTAHSKRRTQSKELDPASARNELLNLLSSRMTYFEGYHSRPNSPSPASPRVLNEPKEHSQKQWARQLRNSNRLEDDSKRWLPEEEDVSFASDAVSLPTESLTYTSPAPHLRQKQFVDSSFDSTLFSPNANPSRPIHTPTKTSFNNSSWPDSSSSFINRKSWPGEREESQVAQLLRSQMEHEARIEAKREELYALDGFSVNKLFSMISQASQPLATPSLGFNYASHILPSDLESFLMKHTRLTDTSYSDERSAQLNLQNGISKMLPPFWKRVSRSSSASMSGVSQGDFDLYLRPFSLRDRHLPSVYTPKDLFPRFAASLLLDLILLEADGERQRSQLWKSGRVSLLEVFRAIASSSATAQSTPDSPQSEYTVGVEALSAFVGVTSNEDRRLVSLNVSLLRIPSCYPFLVAS